MKFVSTRRFLTFITFVAYFKVYIKNNSESATIARVVEDRTILDNIHTHVVSVPDPDRFLNQFVYKQFYRAISEL